MQRTILSHATRLMKLPSTCVASRQALLPCIAASRTYATGPYKFMDVKSENGIATLTLNKPPVNSMNLDVLTEFIIALDKLEADPDTRGLVLTSGIPKVFTAGLELTELYQPEPERLRVFWSTLQELCMRLYGTPLATAAAINGASPAGGLILAMSCDYRVWAEGKHTMGLNEALIGIPPPSWLKNLMQQLIGFRATDSAVQRATMFTNDQALKVGLVDEVVPVGDVVSTARADVEKQLKVPEGGRILAKDMMRRPFIEDFRKHREEELEGVVKLLSAESVQKHLGYYVQMLSKKSKK